MSDTSSLRQLARFVGQSTLSSENAAVHRRTVDGIAARMMPRQRPSVTDLLGVVLALSARTRRAVLPQVTIDLDVFSPHGARAVRMTMSAGA